MICVFCEKFNCVIWSNRALLLLINFGIWPKKLIKAVWPGFFLFKSSRLSTIWPPAKYNLKVPLTNFSLSDAHCKCVFSQACDLPASLAGSLLMGDIAAVQYNKLMPCLYSANFLHICAIHTLHLHYIICVLCENDLYLRLHPKATAFLSWQEAF